MSGGAPRGGRFRAQFWGSRRGGQKTPQKWPEGTKFWTRKPKAPLEISGDFEGSISWKTQKSDPPRRINQALLRVGGPGAIFGVFGQNRQNPHFWPFRHPPGQTRRPDPLSGPKPARTGVWGPDPAPRGPGRPQEPPDTKSSFFRHLRISGKSGGSGGRGVQLLIAVSTS